MGLQIGRPTFITSLFAVADRRQALRARLTAELKEFVVVAIYLLICFGALAYLKAAILRAHGISFAPFVFAAAKALICAKFILIGQAFNLGRRSIGRPLLLTIFYRSIAFLALLIALNSFEEVIVGAIHHRSIADSIAELGGGTLDQAIATAVVMFLVLVPYFAFRSLGEIIGERNLVRLLIEHRRKIDNT